MAAQTDNGSSGTAQPAGPHQRGPVPLFDGQLRLLSECYLTFFQERKKIEETYIESLLKLHRRSQATDAFLDYQSEISSTRSAWFEVRDNLEREAQTRTAFLGTLTVDVLNPLIALKETQDRTRKRIKEDLKDSGNAYNEYVDLTLPKLKRTYIRKCQEAEEHKVNMGPPQTPSHRPQSPNPEQPVSPISNSKSNPNFGGRPVVTAPHPLRPLERRPSGGPPPMARNRSPSASGTAFSDLAQHGKKQLNQLITFLDKGVAKDGLGGRSDNALRSVRAKREAEEADKEYRKGVHWLETLRLRRIKTLESGYKSLEIFVHEGSAMIKQVLEKYTDNLIATTTTQTHLAGHARSVVNRISPDRDASAVVAKIPRSLASAIPKPIRYYNYHVGECADLIFGVSLVDYATTRSLPEGEPPKIVRLCIQEIDRRGLDSEGIYRVSGRHAVVQELQHKVERNERAFEFNSLLDDVTAVSSLFKLYLRELPEPVFRVPLQDRIQHSGEIAEHAANNFALLRSKLRRLPPVHQATLKALLEHLARVVARSEKNKMDPKNLAIVFGGVIFGEDELPKGGDLLSVQSWKDTLMEDLITNAAVLFDERAAFHSPQSSHSPPLPPAPPGEPVPSLYYGTMHTKVATLPPPSPRQPASDFAPALPSRPASSIHPSSRTNASVPTYDKTEPTLPEESAGTASSLCTEHPEEDESEEYGTPDGSPGTSLTAPKSVQTPKSRAQSLPELGPEVPAKPHSEA